ncbi:SusC/RagA family TonB-linked outer membrane protein [Parachryseolinea silvisoli]|uniref:SusC/RagA family TonB-linked outer membrane protein n=1 Tax=Parachryseolinea silvisoli TaxID=2873601 RepID=UPI002265CFC5|nr:TonB-dependent receptor [Parachryseolinea silvisoli]MCD9019281.1 TonB-dependent receptor [Parachryseolinea silvisoli]
MRTLFLPNFPGSGMGRGFPGAVLWGLLLLASVANAQTAVQGTVRDESGAGMPGVYVVVKNTSLGTTTDADGNFSVNVSGNDAVLVFSFIGYATQEVAVNDRTRVDVALAASVQSLDEVVVVGYGTQKKSDITGSLASVSSESLREVPVANVQNALQGRAAGVEVQRIGSTPGSSAQIRIRGERSVSGSNDPLIVLDGIPYQGSLNDINTSDIASIEVLKDASATAIYGSRGANGVILVTTKRGKKGENILSFNSYYGISTVSKKYPVYDAKGYENLRDRSVYLGGYKPEELESIQLGRSTDWQDLMYENGYITDHNLSISGGGDRSTYSVGGGYFKEKGVLPAQDFSRLSLRLTEDLQLNDRVKFGFNSMNSYSIRNGSNISPMFPILSLSPLMPAYEADGTIVKAPAGNDDDRANTYSPLYLKSNDHDWVDRIRRIRTFNSLYGEAEIIPGLTYRLNVGLDYSQEENSQFRGMDTYFTPNAGNYASVDNTEEWSYTVENILMYEKTFAEKHHVKFTGLYSVQESQKHNTFVRKDSITSDFVEYYNLGTSVETANRRLDGKEAKWGIVSYMGRINYSFEDKYLLTLTGRIDGSSRLSEKWHRYPAVSGGWNIIKEDFMQNVRPVSNLKLRVGWGNTSNQAVDPYSLIGGVSNTWRNGTNNVPIVYNFGTKLQNGYYVSRIASEKLVWEFTATTNIGIDFGLFEDRITGSIDWYNARTHNIIYNRTLPATSGVNSDYATNIGKMQNRGVEIAISSINIESPGGFQWSTDFNIFWNRNKLLFLDDGFVRNIENGLHIGEPLTAIYDFDKTGIWQLGEEAQAQAFGQVPGQLKIRDISGPEGVPDGKINPEYDRTIIGSGQAKWQGGITNRFSYKGFDLSFVTYARYGGTLVSAIHQPLAGYLTINDGRRNQLKVDYWTPENPTNDFPAPLATITPPQATSAWTTLGYHDASFVRIRSINFGYKIPTAVAERIRARSIRIYTTVINPVVLYSPYMKAGGVDPEATGTGKTGFVQNGGNIPDRALTVALSSPPTRSFTLGLNITF